MSSSYFESLGRRESEPYTYDDLNYVETEPDLVEATNKQIDENIKDRKQFFQDNIDLYNMTMTARGKRWSDLAKLTKSGKEILDRRRTYKEGENKWDGYWAAYTDPKTKSEFINNSILYENENNELKVEGSKEHGIMLRTGESSDGVTMKPTDIADFNLVIQAGDFDTSLQAIHEMSAHLPAYMSIAEKSLMVNGKLYNDMTYSEQVHWRKIAYARYVEMWRAEHPEIRESDIISKFIGTVEGIEKQWDTTASESHVDATNALASNYQITGLVNSIKAATLNHYNGNEDARVHHLFDHHSYMQQRAEHYKGLGMENPYKLANDDFLEILTKNIHLFNEQDIEYLTEVYKFVPEGQQTETTYANIQRENVSKITNAWNLHKTGEAKQYLENELKALELQVEEGDFVTEAQLAQYFSHPDLNERASDLLERSNRNRNVLGQTEFKSESREIMRNIETYVQNNFTESKDYTWRYAKEEAILGRAKTMFAERLRHYQNLNAENAGQLAKQDVLAALNKKQFDNVATNVYLNGQRGDDLIAAERSYNANFNTTISSEQPYEWEQPYIANAKEFFDTNGGVELDVFWTNLAKKYTGISPFKLAHDRLVAIGAIKPIPQFGVQIDLPKYQVELLINNTDFSRINRAMLSSDDAMNTVLNGLIDPAVNENGGVDAIKVNDQYVVPEEGQPKISEMTVGEIIDKVRSGEISRDTELGIYGLKGDAFIDLFLHANIDTNKIFDRNTQTLLLLERLRYKSNNRLQFRDSDMTYRRLVNVPEADREEFKRIIGDLGPFMDLNTLLPIAAQEHVETNMN